MKNTNIIKNIETFTKAALLLSLTLGLSACGGCDDDQGAPTNQNPDSDMSGADSGPSLDMGMTSPDQDTPPPPPAAAYLVLEAMPVAYVHEPGDEITLSATAFDTREEVMNDEVITWTLAPQGAAMELEPGKWRFDEEGELTFTACTTSLGVDGAPVCADFVALVDSAPPTVSITSPTPGQELDGASSPTITVTGVVTDTSELAPRAYLNGEPLTLDAQGNFSQEVPAHFGVNHLEVVATDARQRDIASQALDVLWAPAYHPTLMDGSSGARFEDGLILSLGQRFFDDGRLPVQNAEGLTFTEDLADILTLLLRHIDLLALVPNPVSDTPSFSLSISRIALGKPVVSLHVTDTGLELFLSAPALSIDTSGALDFEGAGLMLDGGIAASVSILAQVTISRADVDAPFVVDVDDLQVAIENATSNFTDERANAVFTLAESALRLKLESVVTQSLRDSFIDAIPALLEDALNGISSSLAGQTFPLDANLGTPPVDISFSGKITEFEPVADRAVMLGIDTTLTAMAMPAHPDSPGVAMMQPYLPFEVDLLEQGRAQIALRLGLINGLLHGLWDANFFEIDATTLLTEDLKTLVKEARISAKMPPVLSPPLKGEPHAMMLELGQLQLELRTALGNQLVTYGVSLRAGVDFALKDNALSLTIAQEPQVTIWVIEVENDERARLRPEQLTVLFLDVLWPQLVDSLGAGLSLPLPVLTIPQLGMYAPRLNDLTLSFEQLRDVEQRDGFLLIDASLRGKLPAAP